MGISLTGFGVERRVGASSTVTQGRITTGRTAESAAADPHTNGVQLGPTGVDAITKHYLGLATNNVHRLLTREGDRLHFSRDNGINRGGVEGAYEWMTNGALDCATFPTAVELQRRIAVCVAEYNAVMDAHHFAEKGNYPPDHAKHVAMTAGVVVGHAIRQRGKGLDEYLRTFNGTSPPVEAVGS